MVTRIKSLAVSLIASLVFVVIGAQLFNSFEAWECNCSHVECGWCDDEFTWAEFHIDAYSEYADAFTVYFNSLEYKRAKNGASMIRVPGAKSFKFVAKGK